VNEAIQTTANAAATATMAVVKEIGIKRPPRQTEHQWPQQHHQQE
jgi:hypothetical protein